MRFFTVFLSIILIINTFLRADDSLSKLKNDYFMLQLNNEDAEATERLSAIDSLLKYNENGNKINLNLQKAHIFFSLGNYADALDTYQKIKREIPSDSLRLKFYTDYQIGVLKFTLSDYKGALQDAYNILNIQKPDSLQYFDIYPYFILIDFYTMAKDFKLSRKYIDSGLELISSLKPGNAVSDNDKERLLSNMYRVSSWQRIEEGLVDEAYDDLKNAEKYKSNANGLMGNYLLYATIAQKKGEFQLADSYFKKALEINTENFNKGVVLVGYMDLLIEMGKDEEAVMLVQNYPEIVSKIKGSPLETEYLDKIGRIYHVRGQYNNETDVLKDILIAKDSLHRAMIMWDAEEMVRKYEQNKANSEILNLHREINYKVGFIILLSVLVALTLIVIVIIWIRYIQSRKKSEALTAQIIDSEISHKDKMKENKESLETRNRQLMSMTLHMSQLNEALDSIQNSLKNKSVSPEKRLDAINISLKELSRQENVYKIFLTYFESINQTFFSTLYRLHPDLTQGETRMCAFILMGMSNREIADITNRSVRTVEVVKHNLRKKMKLSEPTETYLHRIAEE